MYREPDRDDKRYAYVAGALQKRTALLDRIEIRGLAPTLHRWGIFRTYNLSYVTARNGTSTLSSVEECAHDAANNPTCKPKTVFIYVNDGEGLGFTGAAVGPSSFTVGNGFGSGRTSSDEAPATTLVLDVNGDGAADILDDSGAATEVQHSNYYDVDYETRTHYRLLLSSGDRAHPFADPIDLTFPKGICAGPGSVFDFNYDGKDDILDACPRVGGKYRIFVSSGQGFEEQEITPNAPGNFFPQNRAFIADLNGDTWADLVECVAPDSGDGPMTRLRYFPGTAAGFGARVNLTDNGICAQSQPAPFTAPSPLLVDVDGDGVSNLIQYNGDAGEWRALFLDSATSLGEWRSIGLGLSPALADVQLVDDMKIRAFVKPMDVNGDGLMDLFEQQFVSTFTDYDEQGNKLELASSNPEPEFAVWINEGGHFRETRQLLQSGAATLRQLTGEPFAQGLVFDYDGDGRDDLVAPIHSDIDGTRFFAFRNVSTDPYLVTFESEQTSPAIAGNVISSTRPVAADVDGDGNRDLIQPTPVAGVTLLGIWFGQGLTENKLSSLQDGLGNRIVVEYGTSNEVYLRGTDCSMTAHCLRRANGLVKRQRRESAYNEPRGTWEYSYTDGRIGAYGRGWLGFATRTMRLLDPDGNSAGSTTFEYDNKTPLDNFLYPFAGLVKQRTDYSATEFDGLSASSPIFRETIQSNGWQLLTATSGRPFVAMQNRDTTVSDVALIGGAADVWRWHEDLTYDGYGNITTHLLELLDDSGEVATELLSSAQQFDNLDETDWFIRSPSAIAFGGQKDDSVRANVTTFGDLDEHRRPRLIIHEPDDPTATLTTRLAYDDFGNITEIQREGSGSTRSDAITYDVLNTYPARVTNSYGHVSQVRYDERFALIETLVEPNGLSERYAYDGFGRLTASDTPTGDTSISYRKALPYISEAIPVFGVSQATATISGGPTITTIYDGDSNVLAENRTGFHGQTFSQEYQYDWAGRLIGAARPHLPGNNSQGVIQREYDARGRLESETFPNGNVIERHYSNRLLDGQTQPDLFTDPTANDLVEIIDSDGVRRVEVTNH